MEGATGPAEATTSASPTESFRDSDTFTKRDVLLGIGATKANIEEYIDVCLKGGLPVGEIYGSLYSRPSVRKRVMARFGVPDEAAAATHIQGLIHERMKALGDSQPEPQKAEEKAAPGTALQPIRAADPQLRYVKVGEVIALAPAFAIMLIRNHFSYDEVRRLSGLTDDQLKEAVERFNKDGLKSFTVPSALAPPAAAQQSINISFPIQITVQNEGTRSSGEVKDDDHTAQTHPEPNNRESLSHGGIIKLAPSTIALLAKGEFNAFIDACLAHHRSPAMIARAMFRYGTQSGILERRFGFTDHAKVEKRVWDIVELRVKWHEDNEKALEAAGEAPEKEETPPKHLITLNDEARKQLQELSKNRKMPHMARRAKLLLALDEGKTIGEAAKACKITWPGAQNIKKEYDEIGIRCVTKYLKNLETPEAEQRELEKKAESETPKPPRGYVPTKLNGHPPRVTPESIAILRQGDLARFVDQCLDRSMEHRTIVRVTLILDRRKPIIGKTFGLAEPWQIDLKVRELVEERAKQYKKVSDQEKEPAKPEEQKVDPNDISQRKEWHSLGHGFAPRLSKWMDEALANGDIVGFTRQCKMKGWGSRQVSNAILHSEKAVRHIMETHEVKMKDDIIAKARELVDVAYEKVADPEPAPKAKDGDMAQYVDDRRSGKRGPPKSRHVVPDPKPLRIPEEVLEGEPEEESKEGVSDASSSDKSVASQPQPASNAVKWDIPIVPEARALLRDGRTDAAIGAILRDNIKINEEQLRRTLLKDEAAIDTFRASFGGSIEPSLLKQRATRLIHDAYNKHRRIILGPDADSPRITEDVPQSRSKVVA